MSIGTHSPGGRRIRSVEKPVAGAGERGCFRERMSWSSPRACLVLLEGAVCRVERRVRLTRPGKLAGRRVGVGIGRRLLVAPGVGLWRLLIPVAGRRCWRGLLVVCIGGLLTVRWTGQRGALSGEGSLGDIRVVVAAILLLLRRRRAVSSSVTRTGVSRHISQYRRDSGGVEKEDREWRRGRVVVVGRGRPLARARGVVKGRCVCVVLVPRMTRNSGRRGLYETGRVGRRVQVRRKKVEMKWVGGGGGCRAAAGQGGSASSRRR